MKMNATTGSLYWSKDGRDLNIGPSCILESGKSYYLNVRSHDNNSDSGFVISNYFGSYSGSFFRP